jgi:hypothetical protein
MRSAARNCGCRDIKSLRRYREWMLQCTNGRRQSASWRDLRRHSYLLVDAPGQIAIKLILWRWLRAERSHKCHFRTHATQQTNSICNHHFTNADELFRVLSACLGRSAGLTF